MASQANTRQDKTSSPMASNSDSRSRSATRPRPRPQHQDDHIETESIRIEREVVDQDTMNRQRSHMSGPDDIEPPPSMLYYEAGDEIYERLSKTRKAIILGVMSFCAFLSPTSSTSVLAATPEVAKEYHTSGSVINASNAGYMVFMGLSPIIWGPISQVYGRRPVTLITAVAFFLLSLATALAPNLASFFIFRAISAFEGTAFILIGSACLGDIYRPTERGTAIGWFMSGTLIGPAFGPFLGGIIVTYSSWRSIFWLQTALAGTALLGAFFLVPETIHHKKIDDLKSYTRKERARALWRMVNPIRVLVLFRFWNLVLVGLSSSVLVWNMYSLLTPIRYVLNPRFHLETPLLGGLFYLAPGVGYLSGTFVGGRWADRTVKKWIRKRDGVRVPEDRLRSLVPFMGIVIPACILVYGWTVEKTVGGISVPVIVLFLQGVCQLICFPSLNSYLLDVIPGEGAEVAAANFFVRYLAGCVGTGVVLPIIEAIGVGWFSTISAILVIVGTLAAMWTIRCHETWRVKIEAYRDKLSKPSPSQDAEIRSDIDAAEQDTRDGDEAEKGALGSPVTGLDRARGETTGDEKEKGVGH